jgi:hypothetical protein
MPHLFTTSCCVLCAWCCYLSQIPEALIPFWKKPAPSPPGLSATARLLIYVFSAVTALMLGVLLGLAVYLHVLRKRQAARSAELMGVYGAGSDLAISEVYGPPESLAYGPKGDYHPPAPSSTGPSPVPQHPGEYDYDEHEGHPRQPYSSSQGEGGVRGASVLAEHEGWNGNGTRRAYTHSPR